MAIDRWAKELYKGEIELAEVLRTAATEWSRRDDENMIEDVRMGAFQWQARKVLQHLNGDRR